LHYQLSRLAGILLKSNRGIKITFLTNPLVFFFFLRTSNIKNWPRVLLNVLSLYRLFLGVLLSYLLLSFKCPQKSYKSGEISTCNFRFLKFKKKEAFFFVHIFSVDAPISDNNHFSEYCTISYRGSPEIFWSPTAA